MQLLTKEIRGKLPAMGSTSNEKDPMVQAKFFTPDAQWTWFPYEFDGEDIFFGYVKGIENELGTFSLRELKELRGPMGLPIERDRYFKPCPLSEVMKD